MAYGLTNNQQMELIFMTAIHRYLKIIPNLAEQLIQERDVDPCGLSFNEKISTLLAQKKVSVPLPLQNLQLG